MSVTEQQPTPSEEYGVSYDRLPEHMRDGARLYIEDGIAPGGFLISILTNDLRCAIQGADPINRDTLDEWLWWRGDIPPQAHGDLETVLAWCKAHGLHQFEAQVPA